MFPVLWFFWDRFHHRMVAFLGRVPQFRKEVENGETHCCLPFRVDVDEGKAEDRGGRCGLFHQNPV